MDRVSGSLLMPRMFKFIYYKKIPRMKCLNALKLRKSWNSSKLRRHPKKSNRLPPLKSSKHFNCDFKSQRQANYTDFDRINFVERSNISFMRRERLDQGQNLMANDSPTSKLSSFNSSLGEKRSSIRNSRFNYFAQSTEGSDNSELPSGCRWDPVTEMGEAFETDQCIDSAKDFGLNAFHPKATTHADPNRRDQKTQTENLKGEGEKEEVRDKELILPLLPRVVITHKKRPN